MTTTPQRDPFDLVTYIAVIICMLTLLTINVGAWLTVIVPLMNGNINP
jgi:hypothetical protein